MTKNEKPLHHKQKEDHINGLRHILDAVGLPNL